MASEEMQPLPEADPKLAGESVETGKGDRYHIKVSNAKGYLCHIHMEVLHQLSPLLNACMHFLHVHGMHHAGASHAPHDHGVLADLELLYANYEVLKGVFYLFHSPAMTARQSGSLPSSQTQVSHGCICCQLRVLPVQDCVQ